MAKQTNKPKKESQGTRSAQDAFSAFLAKLKEGQTYILEKERTEIFTKDKVNETYNLFCDKSTLTEKSEKTTTNKDLKFESVIQKIAEDKNLSEEAKIIINHANWLWGLLPDFTTKWLFTDPNIEYNDDLLKIQGVAGVGPGYRQTKTNGVRFILFLFTQLVNPAESSKLEEIIIKNCLIKNENDSLYDNNKYSLPDGVTNLLLHVCAPEKYMAIAASKDKEKIVKTFKSLLGEEEKDADVDAKVVKIHKKLEEKKIIDEKDTFYSNSIPLMWKGESTEDLSLVQKLEYKKALILYGPPGTGKTYTAHELAKEILVRHYMKCFNKNRDFDTLKKNLDNLENDLRDHTSYLQFHINYNYEDFIAGQIIQNNSIVTQKGFIYTVVEKAKKAKDDNTEKPYVVILDEINRTDISRVFGELFTAIEKRGEDVTLTLPDPENNNKSLVLNIPDNVYFIGTMNEIDFSLERVDFALRRRFIWEFHDYNEDALLSIINSRVEGKTEKDYNPDEFCKSCTALNDEVNKAMGKEYHIGHAFFAEIANIYIKLYGTTNNTPWGKAKKILWQISIKPTLEAYCGTMDKSDKDNYLKDKKDKKEKGVFYKAFFQN